MEILINVWENRLNSGDVVAGVCTAFPPSPGVRVTFFYFYIFSQASLPILCKHEKRFIFLE